MAMTSGTRGTSFPAVGYRAGLTRTLCPAGHRSSMRPLTTTCRTTHTPGLAKISGPRPPGGAQDAREEKAQGPRRWSDTDDVCHGPSRGAAGQGRPGRRQGGDRGPPASLTPHNQPPPAPAGPPPPELSSRLHASWACRPPRRGLERRHCTRHGTPPSRGARENTDANRAVWTQYPPWPQCTSEEPNWCPCREGRETAEPPPPQGLRNAAQRRTSGRHRGPPR